MSLTKRQRRLKRNARRIRSSGFRNTIPYPDFESEFEVQANLYSLLKARGYRVRGCVQAWCEDPDPHRVYFDLVIYDGSNEAIAVVECKNDQCALTELPSGTRQHRRYQKFGVPVIKCAGSQYIERTVQQLNSLLMTEQARWALNWERPLHEVGREGF